MITVFVPGRLCLFGEHSDWAGALRAQDASVVPGACIVTGTEQGITATVEPAPHFEMTSRLPDGQRLGPVCWPMEERVLRAAAAAGDFFSYVAGTVAEISARCAPPGIRVLADDVNLPVQRGLSSSAAVCVLIVRAFNVVHRLGLSVREEMEVAYRGERAAGSQCGRMDQACAYGKRPVLLRFDGTTLDVETLAVGRAVHLLIADLCHDKDTRRILTDLHAAFTAPEGPRRRALRDALGPRNVALVEAARAALVCGDAAVLGRLMREAQQLFDRCVAPASPAELGAPRLHALLEHPAVRELSHGGKGVGSQGDGAAQLVCRGPGERIELMRRLAADALARCVPLTIDPADAPVPQPIDSAPPDGGGRARGC